MLDEKILEYFKRNTPEEEYIIKYHTIDKDLYTNDNKQDFVIAYDKIANHKKYVTMRKHTRYINFPKHRHDFMELTYVLSGQVTHVLDNEEVTIKAGQLLILNQYIDHSINLTTKEDIAINFFIHPDYLLEIVRSISENNIVTKFLLNTIYSSSHNAQYIFFDSSQIRQVDTIMSSLIKSFLKSQKLSDVSKKMYFVLLFIELIRHIHKARFGHMDAVQTHTILEALKYIEEEYQSANMKILSTRLGIPSYIISREVKKYTGKTFTELLQKYRLQKATYLIQNTDYSMSTIAEEVGYENISYFYRLFNKTFGVTPKEYQLKMSEKIMQ